MWPLWLALEPSSDADALFQSEKNEEFWQPLCCLRVFQMVLCCRGHTTVARDLAGDKQNVNVGYVWSVARALFFCGKIAGAVRSSLDVQCCWCNPASEWVNQLMI